MSEVKRFSWVGIRGLAEQHNGNWVKYDDYAALQQKLDAVLTVLEQQAVWYDGLSN